jgi:hypothetical protein
MRVIGADDFELAAAGVADRRKVIARIDQVSPERIISEVTSRPRVADGLPIAKEESAAFGRRGRARVRDDGGFDGREDRHPSTTLKRAHFTADA